jgi:putative inorganic carbon (hco3(-)) transporter
MRDALLTLIVFGTIPFILARPHLGVYMWSWLGYMNPHRFSWGFAATFPFVQATALALLLGAIFSREKKSLPINGATVCWMLFLVFVCLTTLFATNPVEAGPQLEKVLKIQYGTLMTLLLITSRERLHGLVWVIVLSMGFYGFKGGLFAVQGTSGLVWGPSGTFIAGNNELALALLMTVPLMRFLQMHTKDWRIGWALIGLMGLTMFSVAGSYSRGAFIAAGCMLVFLWWKGRNRAITGVLGAGFVGVVLSLMPQKWWDRMSTIKTFDEDASARGRFDAWETAIGLGNGRFLGGGFEAWTPENFARYGGGADLVRDVHSVYFEVLGEHGYIGLFLFLGMWAFTWLLASRVIRMAARNSSLVWHADLARMTQVSIIAYLAGGAFLGLAYFDLPYHLMTIAVIAHVLARREVATAGDGSTQASAAVATPARLGSR